MLCKQIPKNKEKYYATHDVRIIYPLYSDGTIFYFIKTEKFEKYMSTTDVNL